MALQNDNNTKTQSYKAKINNLHKTLSLFLAKFRGMLLNMGYGFRPLRGCKLVLRAVDRCLKAGQTWVVDADMKNSSAVGSS
jgi:retron-type reverse transcriptase